MVEVLNEEQNLSVNTIVQERRTLREWKETVSLRTPNFLWHYSEIVEYLEAFPPCKIDVSPKEDMLALMSHNRELEIYELSDDNIAIRARVKVLEERYPEWCLLKFTASGSLLLSTRSNAIIDVFDSSGNYCYRIAVSKCVEPFDAASVICDIVSASPSNEVTKYLDTVYTLQYNSVFSCYKLGLTVGHISLFKVDLAQSLTTSFILLPDIDLLIVAGQHRSFTEVELVDCNSVGLNVYRIVNEEPFVVDVRVSKTEISFFELLTGWLPYKKSYNGVIVSMASSRKYSHLSVISSTGDVFLFALPSVRLLKHISYSNALDKPIQTLWVNKEEVAFLTCHGSFLRGKVDDLERFLLERSTDTEVFAQSSTAFSPKAGVVIALESKVLSTEGSRSAKENRAWLAAKLRLTTLYDYVKAYVDAAIGQPLVDVPEAVEKREIHFSLHQIRSVTLRHMLKELLMHGDFAGALELTQKHNIENTDFVYKEQWRQLGKNVTEASIQDVLMHINDKDWVLFECVNSQALDLKSHRALINLAKKITAGEKNFQRAFILHCERVLDLALTFDENCDKTAMFTQFRSQSLLDVAIYFSKTAKLEILEEKLIKDPILQPHLFTLLWLIPEVISPGKYEFLIPHKTIHWFDIASADASPSSLELQSLSELLGDVVETLNYKSDVYEENEFLRPLMENSDVELDNVLRFLKSRCFQIDAFTGLIDLSIEFVQITISHGFQAMEEFLVDLMFYSDFVVFCGLVSISLEQFNCSKSDVIFKTIEKHMTENDVCTKIARILELLEYLFNCGRCDSLEDQLESFLCSYSKKSLRVLENTLKTRPDWVTEKVLLKCFCTYETVGKLLIENAIKAKLSSKYIKALKAFAVYKLEPNFEQLHVSFSDISLARQLLYQFIRSAACTTYPQWRKLKNDLMEIYTTFYSHLFTEEEILKMFADEMLDLNDIRKTRELIGLVLSFDTADKNNQEKYCLSTEVAVDLLIEKSENFYSSAMPDWKDPNLRLAREVLELIPHGCKQAKLKLTKQIKLLDAFDVALGLDCTLLPVKFKHSDPESLFADIVRIGENYKKLKECAKLAQLLNIRTPVARSMELCAVEALLRRDVKFLRKYCDALLKISESQALPLGMHSLCIDVFKSGLLTELEDELLACAILSSPPEDILDTLCLLQRREISDKNLAISFCKPTPELALDPVYSLVEEYVPVNQSHSMLTDNPIVQIDLLSTCNQAAFHNAVANLARHYTHISSTMALGLSLLLPDDVEWTENLVLTKYSRAIKSALEDLSFKKVQLLPALYLIEKYSKTVSGETALERILKSGCDRERFFEDSQYREETLNGIAMTMDLSVIKDCIEVGQKYSLDTWNICLSALEYVITDPEVPVENLQTLVTNLGVLEELQSNKERLYTHLRSKTLKAILATPVNDVRTEVYLSLFVDSEPEHKWLKSLNCINGILTGCASAALIVGEPSQTVPIFLPHLEDKCDELVQNLLLLPKGSDMCEHAAEIVFSKERRDPKHLRKCFLLLNKDCERVVDLISALSASDETSYLTFVVNNCEFDESMLSLRTALIDLLQNLQRLPNPSGTFDSKAAHLTSTTSLRRRHH